MRAPEREVDNVTPGCWDDAPCRLAGDHRFVSHAVEEKRLDQLGLRQRGGHLDQRFAGEGDPAFGNRPDLPGEAKSPERFQVRGGEAETIAQEAKVLFFESQLLEKVQT